MKKTVLFFLLAAGLCSCTAVLKDGYHGYLGEHPGYNGTGDVMPPGDYPPTGDHFDLVMENPFIRTAEKPVSSFSVDADGASYAYMRRCATTSGRVDPNSVRIEEYLNYFTFDYPEPTGEETLAINAEASACPWAPDHLLLRLGLKGKSIPESQIPAANYILLIDTSGSMSGSDRMDLVKTGLCAMVDAMRPDDRIAIITYSGSVQKLVESTLISTGASAIKAAIRSLIANGGTAGGPAMKMAYEEASAHYIEGGNNRIIMCTDGDFNVGVSSTDALVKMVESYQKSGIYLSIMGFGTGNYQDSRMESLSNHGNGTYNYIDSEQEMIKVFVNERSHFWAVANDSKCQVRFHPEAVAEYRLLGYENRLMSEEEFEDSNKDAGEIGAGQTVTALYEIIPAEGYTKNASLATFETRYKFSLKDTESRSLTTEVKVSDTASENMNFAAGVAAYAMVLRNSMYKGKATLSLAKELVSGASTYDPDGFRAELLGLMEIVRP